MLLVMSSVAISDSIVVSFFGNFMLKEYKLRESGSGWILTVAAIFYTSSTFAAGVIGTKQSVGLINRVHVLRWILTESHSIITDY